MGETQLHLDLVDLLVRYAEWRLRDHAAVALFADRPSAPRSSKPPPLGGYVPDVLAVDVPTTTRLIGEAKTAIDLEAPHTVLQLKAFLEHLRLLGGVFVLAVPWQAGGAGRRLVAEVCKATGAGGVEVVILDGLRPWR